MLIESYFIGIILQKRAECGEEEKVILTKQGAIIVSKTRIDRLIARIIK